MREANGPCRRGPALVVLCGGSSCRLWNLRLASTPRTARQDPSKRYAGEIPFANKGVG